MRYFSMFSGIGGFEYGIQQASSNRTLGDRQQPTEKTNIRQKQDSTNSTSSVGNGRWELPECVGYSEIDKYAIKVYERQFNGNMGSTQTWNEGLGNSESTRTSSKPKSSGVEPLRGVRNDKWKGHTNYGNATTINAKELPDFDLLVGGFPCQAFSIAGKRAGFDDTRGTLFFDIARILKEKQPRNLVLENVKGLLSHDGGRTFTTIIGVLADLGYFVEWQVLNSKDFGVPQNRERVIIVGHLGGEPRRKVFPITGTNRANTYVRTIRAGGAGSATEKHARDLIQVLPVLTPNRVQKRQNGRRFKEAGDPSFTLTGQDIHGVAINTRIRRLTPLECERLQGFPDDWTKYGIGDELISDTQRYKMCGNAVTTNVIEAVMKKLL